MKAKLEIAGDANFVLCLIPETEAERDILKRVGEQKRLTAFWNSDTYSRLQNSQLQIYPVLEPKADE